MTALDARPHWQVRNRSTDVTQFGNSQKEVTSNSFCDNDLNMTVPLVSGTFSHILRKFSYSDIRWADLSMVPVHGSFATDSLSLRELAKL
jgi:hypothetical protein